MTSFSSGDRAAAKVDEEEEEAEALVERYALDGACKVLVGTPVLLRATPLTGGVNFIVYSC
jgi:isoamylase